MPRYYKELRTKKERRELYKKLREAGASSYLARQARDWSIGHIRRLIKTLNGGKNGCIEMPKL